MIGVHDEYGAVVNSKKAYKYIAGFIRYCPMFLAWTDGQGTQYDILLALKPDVFGQVQGGLHDADLFVNIMRVGAFGFDVNNLPISQSYIAEKLNMDKGETCLALTDFINGVRHYLFDVGAYGVKE